MIGKLLKRKKSEAVLEIIVELIPKIIIFLILLGILSIIYQLFFDKPEYSRLEESFRLLSKDIKDIREGEKINLPVMPGEYSYVSYPEGNDMEEACKKKPCFCVYWQKKGNAESKCEIFDKLKVQHSCVQVTKDTKFVTLKKENERISFEGTC